MRTFRGIHEEYGWRYGYFTDNRFENPSIWDDGYRYEVDIKTVGESTGFIDKNYKDIFEGDKLLIDSKYVGIVKWSDSTAGFYLFVEEGINHGTHIERDVNFNVFRDYQVIGNIHEKEEGGE